MSAVVKSWLMLTAIFAIGIVTGGALTMGYDSYFAGPPGEKQRVVHILTHLTRTLNLSPAQQTRIQPIVTDMEHQIQALHHQEVDRFSSIMADGDAKIAALLTPEQKIKMQNMENDRQKQFSGHLHPRMPQQTSGALPSGEPPSPPPGA